MDSRQNIFMPVQQCHQLLLIITSSECHVNCVCRTYLGSYMQAMEKGRRKDICEFIDLSMESKAAAKKKISFQW
jgi:hypothetical protein